MTRYRHELKQEISPADAPLCSYGYITVNGSDWGLYLAVEGVEDSFLRRNYGGQFPAADENARPGMGGRSAFQD